MSGVLLDTNTLSYLLDPAALVHRAVALRFAQDARARFVSVLSAYELTLFQKARLGHGLGLEGLLSGLAILAVPAEGADIFAHMKLALAGSRGAKVASLARHNIDIALAATAIVEDLALVSNDSIFPELAAIDPRLNVEDWTT